MIKTCIDEFTPEDITMMRLKGQITFDESASVEVYDDTLRFTFGDASHWMTLDEMIFQPLDRKEVLYDVVKIKDKYYLNTWGKSSIKYYLILVTNPDIDTMNKYMVRLSREKQSLNWR